MTATRCTSKLTNKALRTLLDATSSPHHADQMLSEMHRRGCASRVQVQRESRRIQRSMGGWSKSHKKGRKR